MKLGRPDFSGTWRFNPHRSVLQIPAPDSTLFVIDHQEPALRIRRTHVAGEKSDTFSLDLTTDGQEVSVDRDGLLIHCRVFWDGDSLVFDTKLVRSGEAATNLVTYTLSSDSSSLLAKEIFRSRDLSYDNTWHLDKV